MKNMTIDEFKSRKHFGILTGDGGDDPVISAVQQARVHAVRGAADSRSRSIALTKLDEAALWWQAALRESQPRDFSEPPHPAEGSRVSICVAAKDDGGTGPTPRPATVLGSSVDGRLVVKDEDGNITTLSHIDSVMPGAIGWSA